MQNKWLQIQRAEFGRWAYYLQSLALPVFITAMAWFGFWLPSVILLLLSKWRSLFFPPRFWPVTFRTSVIDLAVGAAFTLFQWRVIGGLEGSFDITRMLVAIVAAIGYALWHTVVRHHESMKWHRLQGLIAIFCGTWLVDNALVDSSSALKLVALALLFYTCYRHIFFSVKEPLEHVRAVVWALIASQFWLVSSFYYIDKQIGWGMLLTLASVTIASIYYLSSFMYDSQARLSMKYYYAAIGIVIVGSIIVTLGA